MPAEIRYIAFPPVDVVRAISDYQKRRRQPLPRGAVLGFDVYATPAIEATLRIVNDVTGDEGRVTIRAEQLAAAMVLHCIGQRIPIPARAQKLLFQGRDGGVVMGYALGLDDVDRSAFADATPPIFVDPDAPAGTPSDRRGPPPPEPEAAPGGTAAPADAGDEPAIGTAAGDGPGAAGETARRRKAFEYQMRRAEREG